MKKILIIIAVVIAFIKRKSIRAFFSGKPKWIVIAEAEIGEKEVKGGQNNARIVEYHAATSGKASTDAVAWCSSFVNWVMEKAGEEKTGSAMAVSWRKYGKKLDRPCYGCIAVMSYGDGFGHVGFVVGKQGSKLLLLGGNQSDSVKISAFPTTQIIAYVVPANYTPPASAYDLQEGDGSSATTR